MRKITFLPLTLAAILLVGACGSSSTPTPADTAAPSTGASPTDVATNGATNAPTTGATNAPTASGSTSSTAPSGATSGSPATSAAAQTCTPDAPTALSKDWVVLKSHDGDYSYSYPSTWEKLYGAFVFKTSSLVDAATFAETGLIPSATTLADLVRQPGTGLPNASALIVPGVTSSNQVIFQRQIDRFKASAGLTVQKTDLTACLGGEQALGIQLTFNNGATLQQSWFVVHAGRSYDFQWLAPSDSPATDQFAEIMRTWVWTPGIPTATPIPSGAPQVTPAPTVASVFVNAGMQLTIDTTAKTADPTKYTNTLPKTAKAIYAVWTLQPGSVGRVEGVLAKDGASLLLISLDYGAKTQWGNFKINSASGFAAGNYIMQLKFVPTGEIIQIPFTVK